MCVIHSKEKHFCQENELFTHLLTITIFKNRILNFATKKGSTLSQTVGAWGNTSLSF